MLADTSFTASYDAGNRITNWNRAGAPVNNAQSWNYDDNGNWISTTNDAKGNLTEYEINGKEYEVDYDLDNRIIKVDVDNDDVEYRYDALGRRVIRQEGTTKTALIWWGNSENAEHKHQAGQTVIQNDIMAHPSRLNSVIARAVDGSKFKLEWYHKNYLDHVYAVSDDSGDILEHYRYTAFGEVTIYNSNGNQVATTQIDNHILWNTRRRDELTGYYMYKFRHYSAELGRWLARDPIEEDGGVNLYGFVGNDPIGSWDRLGLKIFAPKAEDLKFEPGKNCIELTIAEYRILQRKWGKPVNSDGLTDREILILAHGCIGNCLVAQGSGPDDKYHNKPEVFANTKCWAGSKGRAKAEAAAKKCPKGSSPLIWAKQGDWKDRKNLPKNGSQIANDSIEHVGEDTSMFNYVTRLGDYYVDMVSHSWKNSSDPPVWDNIQFEYKVIKICKKPINTGYPAEMWCMSCCPNNKKEGYHDGY